MNQNIHTFKPQCDKVHGATCKFDVVVSSAPYWYKQEADSQ